MSLIYATSVCSHHLSKPDQRMGLRTKASWCASYIFVANTQLYIYPSSEPSHVKLHKIYNGYQ